MQSEATPARLAGEIGALLGDRARREAMADAARKMGRPRAAWDVAGDLLHLANIPLRISRQETNGSRLEVS